MYDWPECGAEVDAHWARVRGRLIRAGFEAPLRLIRRNADMPPVPGGIRDAAGRIVAPDPASLPPDDLSLPVLWRHPALLFGQTCWGPIETTGLVEFVRVIGQPDYSDVEGGRGELYSSAIVVKDDGGGHVAAPDDGQPILPLEHLEGARFAFNSDDSMSGLLAITRDLEANGASMDVVKEKVETGGHRRSIEAVAAGAADVATIDCRSWALARRHEPSARAVRVVGWTRRRKGLPFITSAGTPEMDWASILAPQA